MAGPAARHPFFGTRLAHVNGSGGFHRLIGTLAIGAPASTRAVSWLVLASTLVVLPLALASARVVTPLALASAPVSTPLALAVPAAPGEESAVEMRDFIRGVDISTLEKVEHYGGRFFDGGVERDVLDILRDRGVNWVRLRVWHDPVLEGGFSDRESLVRMAARVKAKGFKLLVNFHYSDHWADPGKQTKPAAWQELSFPELTQAVYEYTRDVVQDLAQAGALPDMVQIGNEIRAGMLWPDGRLGTPANEYGSDFDRLAALLKAGIEGVHAGSRAWLAAQGGAAPVGAGSDRGRVLIALHLDDGGNNGLYRWWFDEITRRDVPFDVIGVSYYPYWHGTIEQLKRNLADISRRYDKDVAVFETAYAFTLADADGHPNIFGPQQARTAGYPVSVEGQAAALRAVFEAVAQVPGGRGLGVFYWEPAWLGVKGAGWTHGEGNAWENQAMFDFAGNALESLHVFATAGQR